MITWAITVCDEAIELNRLLNKLIWRLNSDDEILIQCDEEKTTDAVEHVIESHQLRFDRFKVVYYPLNGDFSKFKNNIFDQASEPWIFQIDADEYPSDNLILQAHDLISSNLDVDCFDVSRINIVKDITLHHVRKWGWNISSNPAVKHSCFRDEISDGYYQLLKHYNLILSDGDDTMTYLVPLINWPDHQRRIYRNIPSLRWVNVVHEQLVGVNKSAKIDDIEWSLVHSKDILRQERQNEFYTTLL